MNDNVFKLECFFEGHVQGVGFRYQTVSVAKGYEVSGTVQNLLDGRVKLFVEGLETEVREFVKAVELELSDYIRKSEIHGSEGPRTCQGFSIVC
jgi:acylphosphatase